MCAEDPDGNPDVRPTLDVEFIPANSFPREFFSEKMS